MFGKLEVTRMAQSLASYAGARQGVVAENIAQADTPGYRARDLQGFAQTYRDGAAGDMRATRAGHIRAGSPSMQPQPILLAEAETPSGNSVSLETEMVKAVEVQQQHDMALAVYRSVSDIVRASLGRR